MSEYEPKHRGEPVDDYPTEEFAADFIINLFTAKDISPGNEVLVKFQHAEGGRGGEIHVVPLLKSLVVSAEPMPWEEKR